MSDFELTEEEKLAVVKDLIPKLAKRFVTRCEVMIRYGDSLDDHWAVAKRDNKARLISLIDELDGFSEKTVVKKVLERG